MTNAENATRRGRYAATLTSVRQSMVKANRDWSYDAKRNDAKIARFFTKWSEFDVAQTARRRNIIILLSLRSRKLWANHKLSSGGIVPTPASLHYLLRANVAFALEQAHFIRFGFDTHCYFGFDE